MPHDPLTIRLARTADIPALARLDATTFRESSSPQTPVEDIDAFVAASCTELKASADLQNPDKVKFVADIDGVVVGFATLFSRPAPPCVAGPAPTSLQTIGVDRAYYGRGVGAALMDAILKEAASRGHQALWLGVEERNARAIAFYRKWSFVDVGSRIFPVGREQQVDRIMMRPL